METTYKIPGPNIEALKRKLDVLVRRAARLGCPDISYTVGPVEHVKYADEDGFLKTRRLYPVTVTGPEPKLAGWEFLATIDFVEDEFLMAKLPEVEERFPNLREYVGDGCDHCGTDRRRKSLYLVANEDGTVKRVGSTCLKDFIGHGSPEALVRSMTYLMTAMGACEGAEYWERDTCHTTVRYDLTATLALAAAVIEECGWVSKGRAYETGIRATAERVEVALDCRKKSGVMPYEVTEAHREVATKVVEWMVELATTDGLDDYLENLGVLGKIGYIPAKRMGLAVSALTAYDRFMADRVKKALEAKMRTESDHFGKVKERLTVTLTHIVTRTFEGEYGATHFHRFVEAETGNAVVWSSSAYCPVEVTKDCWRAFEPGMTYKIKGTVKKHSEYNGIKETYLTRCKVLETLLGIKKNGVDMATI